MNDIFIFDDGSGAVVEIGGYLEVTYGCYPNYPDSRDFVHGRVRIANNAFSDERTFLNTFLREQEIVFKKMNEQISQLKNQGEPV